MRLFIAIDLEQTDFFLALQKPFRDISGAHMSFPVSTHITLSFLGEVDQNRCNHVLNALSPLSFKQFSIRCDHLGRFPEFGPPRVIWAGFAGSPARPNHEHIYQEGYDAILKLHRDIYTALKPLGFNAEKQFVPHVTLARVKNVTLAGRKAIERILKTVKVEPHWFDVISFKLITSTLGREEPRYDVVWESYAAINTSRQ